MPRHMLALASLVTVFVLCAASPRGLPPEVAAHLDEMDNVCKVVGKPLKSKLVEHGNLVAKGMEIWAIDEGKYECDGAASLFSGSGGAEVVVFMRMPDNSIKQVFEHGAYGMRMERSGASDTIWLTIGGPLCGQPGNPSHAASIHCERPLQWDAAKQRMDFAPLSQARFK